MMSSVSKLAASAGCSILVSSSVTDPFSAEALLRAVYREGIWNIGIFDLFSNPDNVNALLAVAADAKVDCKARICIIESLVSWTNKAHAQGAYSVCIGIMQEPTTGTRVPETLLNSARKLFSGGAFDDDIVKRMELIKDLVRSLSTVSSTNQQSSSSLNSTVETALTAARTLKLLTGWYFNERTMLYNTDIGPLDNIVEEEGMIEEIISAIKQSSSFEMICDLSVVLYRIMTSSNAEGCSILLNLDIANITLQQLVNSQDKLKCVELMHLFYVIVQTQTGQDKVLATAIDINALFTDIIECLEKNDELIKSQPTLINLSNMFIQSVSKLSFHTKIHPFLNSLLSKIEKSDIVKFLIGALASVSVCSFVYVHSKVSEMIFSKILVKSSKALTNGELRLLTGFIDHCLGHEIDELLGKGIIDFLVASTRIPETALRAWQCAKSLVMSSQKALKLVCTSDAVNSLPQYLESVDNKTYFFQCCSIIEEILKFEEGAASLPTKQLIHALAARLDISDDFIATRNSSPIPEAIKAAELLKLIIDKQPPASMKSVLNATYDACSSNIFKLFLKYRSITDNSSSKFSELGTALKNCDAFIAFKASSLKSFLTGVTENNINWDEFCIITKFPPAKGESSYTDKQFTDILELVSKTGSSTEVTEDSRISFYLLLTKVLGCLNSTTKKRILEASIDMMIATSSKLSLTEMSIILDLISNLIDGSVDELLDLVVQKPSFISKLLALFKENLKGQHCLVYQIMPFIKKMIDKYFVKGKEKMKVLGEILLSSSIVDVMKGVETTEINNTFSDWYRILGRLSAVESAKAHIMEIVIKLPFKQIETFMSNDEGFLSGTSDVKLFQLACDSLTKSSIFDALTNQEKISLLGVINRFADNKSPQLSTTLAALAPRTVDIIHKYTSKFSLTCQDIVNKCINCFVNWYSINELTLATVEMKDLFLKLLVTSFEVGRVPRFDSLVAILKSCVKHTDTKFEEFVKEVLSTLVSYVSSSKNSNSNSNSSLLNRMAIAFLQKLIPHADGSPAVIKFVSVCTDAGLVSKLIDIIKACNGEWDRFRLLDTLNLMGMLLSTESETAILSFNKSSGFNLLLQNIKHDLYNFRQGYLYNLQNYVLAAKLPDREALLDNGLLLEAAESVVREGPLAKGYLMILAILQLLCVRGSDRLRELIPRSKACQIMVEALVDGSCLDINLTRTHYLVAYSSHLNVKANSYIIGLIDSLDPSDIKKSIKVMNKLISMFYARSQQLQDIYEKQGIATKLLALYNATSVTDEIASILAFANLLAIYIPKTFVIFDKVCALKLQSKLLDNEVPKAEVSMLSSVSQYSSRARAIIASLPYRIHEEADTGSEFFTNSIFDILISICESDEGVHALADSGGIEIITQSLVRVKTTDAKCKVMQLLSAICKFESNRSRLRSLIEPIFSILKTHFHMIIAPSVSDKCSNIIDSNSALDSSAATSNDSKKLFDFDVFLSHNWGLDELNRDNHARVSKINSELQLRGLKTWLDKDQMRGSINSKMMDGITKSAVVIVFVTNSFIKKASGFGDKGEDDSCFFEFDCAIQERGRGNIISVVMEPSCKDTGTWLVGVVKGKLGSKLYIDLSDDESSSNYVDGFNSLLKEITIISGKTFGKTSADNSNNCISDNIANNSIVNSPSPRSPKSPTSPTSPGKSSQKSSKFKDTSTTADDLKIGSQALNLLKMLSYSDSNRSSFENIDSLIPYVEYICERHKDNRDNAICLLVNVFAPILHLKGKNDLLDKNYIIIKESLVPLSVFKDLRSSFKKKWRDVLITKTMSWEFSLDLQFVLNFVACEQFCEKLMTTKIIELVIETMFDGLVTLVRLRTAHKITASDIIMRCAQNPDYRTALKEYGADKLLRLFNGSVKPDDDDEENARLWFSSKQALESLSGKLDANGIYSTSLKTSELLKKPRLDESDFGDLPTFQTFISHKRSSAQDFARLLHSLIIGGGLTCFLDVENLDRLDMLTLLVAGCDVFVCVLSDDVFQSPFWKKELACAVSLSIPVILVVKEGSRWPDRFGQLTDSFPSYELIDKEFQGDYACCRDVFKSKAVQHSNEYFRSFSFNIIHKIESQLKEFEKNRDRTVSKKELIQRRRRSIFVSGKFDMSTGSSNGDSSSNGSSNGSGHDLNSKSSFNLSMTSTLHPNSSVGSFGSSPGVQKEHSEEFNYNDKSAGAMGISGSSGSGGGYGNSAVATTTVDHSSTALAFGSPMRSSSPGRPQQHNALGPNTSSSSSAFHPYLDYPSTGPQSPHQAYPYHHQQQQSHESRHHPSLHSNAYVSSTSFTSPHGHSPHSYNYPIPSSHSPTHYQAPYPHAPPPLSYTSHSHYSHAPPPPPPPQHPHQFHHSSPYSSSLSPPQYHPPPPINYYHEQYQHQYYHHPTPYHHQFGQHGPVHSSPSAPTSSYDPYSRHPPVGYTHNDNNIALPAQLPTATGGGDRSGAIKLALGIDNGSLSAVDAEKVRKLQAILGLL